MWKYATWFRWNNKIGQFFEYKWVIDQLKEYSDQGFWVLYIGDVNWENMYKRKSDWL